MLSATSVVDVTDRPSLLRIARELVAESYSQLSSRPLCKNAVLDELCIDEYDRRGHARTFLAYQNKNNRVIPVGTLRLVVGGSPIGMLPLELMSLVTPADGWNRFRFESFRANFASELCRFVVAPEFRTQGARKLGCPAQITKLLVDEAMRTAHVKGCSQFWAIMPRYVARVVVAAGYTLSEAPGIHLNHKINKELFERFDRYWQKSPKLYRLRKLSPTAPNLIPYAAPSCMETASV